MFPRNAFSSNSNGGFSNLLLPQAIDGRVALALNADLAGEGKGREVPGVDSLLVQVANVDLDAGMVLSGDQLVRPGAADIKMEEQC